MLGMSPELYPGDLVGYNSYPLDFSAPPIGLGLILRKEDIISQRYLTFYYLIYWIKIPRFYNKKINIHPIDYLIKINA